MNINFKDYLSEEEIKEIIIDELRKNRVKNDYIGKMCDFNKRKKE